MEMNSKPIKVQNWQKSLVKKPTDLIMKLLSIMGWSGTFLIIYRFRNLEIYIFENTTYKKLQKKWFIILNFYFCYPKLIQSNFYENDTI